MRPHRYLLFSRLLANQNNRAQSVSIDPESHPPTVKLTTVPLTWQQATSRMSVSLDHSPPSKLDQELRRRQASNGTQEENSKAEFKKLSLNSTGIPDRVQLYPFPVGDGASDTTGEPTTTPGANTAAAPAATNGVAKNAPGEVGKQRCVFCIPYSWSGLLGMNSRKT